MHSEKMSIFFCYTVAARERASNPFTLLRCAVAMIFPMYKFFLSFFIFIWPSGWCFVPLVGIYHWHVRKCNRTSFITG